ncbi:MAG TPA: PQQ-binding-like beta-propeller repeat protein [Actinomycetota bacterium]|nr:PQQ-binding-like beta-propeller repeat protein [Actinomycetota bacterium]
MERKPVVAEVSHRGKAPLVRRGVAVALVAVVAGALSPVPAVAAPGSEAWAQRHEGALKFGEGARAVAVSPDGSTVFVTGGAADQGIEQFVEDNFRLNYVTVAYDADRGDLLWEATYRGPGGYDEPLALAVSPDGSKVFVTGYSRGKGERPTTDHATVAYDAASGEQLWARRYAAGGEGGALAIEVGPDGSTVFVTGVGEVKSASYDYVTIAYSAGRGKRLWLRRFGGRGSDAARSLAVSPDGSKVFVTGSSQVSRRRTERDYSTIAYRAQDGRRLWMTRYRGWSGHAESVAVTPDGSRVVVTGSTSDSDEQSRFTTVVYSPRSGRQLWVAHHKSASGAYAESLALSPDGSKVFVTGWMMHVADNWDYGTVAYRASTGVRLWKARYDNGSFDGASSAVVSPDGSTLYVTGSSQSLASRSDYATVAYRASDGSPRWVSRHDGRLRGGYDGATDIAVRSDGSKVFVTGASDALTKRATLGRLNRYSFETVAYDTR